MFVSSMGDYRPQRKACSNRRKDKVGRERKTALLMLNRTAIDKTGSIVHVVHRCGGPAFAEDHGSEPCERDDHHKTVGPGFILAINIMFVDATGEANRMLPTVR
jgi:hypothetical protein